MQENNQLPAHCPACKEIKAWYDARTGCLVQIIGGMLPDKADVLILKAWIKCEDCKKRFKFNGERSVRSRRAREKGLRSRQE